MVYQNLKLNMNMVKRFKMDMNMKWLDWLVNEEIKLEANKHDFA